MNRNLSILKPSIFITKLLAKTIIIKKHFLILEV